MNAVVYQITNLINGERYIGITSKPLSTRWAKHRLESRNPRFFLHRAIAKYGADMFRIVILKTCCSYDAALSEEIKLIAALRPQYNMTRGGQGALGRPNGPETRRKMSAAKRGKGHFRDAVTRARRSEITKKLWATPEYRARAVAARVGNSYAKGYKCTPEQIENRRRAARISNAKQALLRAARS
jgi:group I intron endonuclease